MKSHVLIGGDILKDFTIVQDVADGARYHHERYDGKGYAKGLKGEEIPLNARIIGIADAFDAMTSNRVYRKRWIWIMCYQNFTREVEHNLIPISLKL